MGERSVRNAEVEGSIPFGSTKDIEFAASSGGFPCLCLRTWLKPVSTYTRIDIEINPKWQSGKRRVRMSTMKSMLCRRFWIVAFAGLLVFSSVGEAGAPGNSITVVSDHPPGKSKAELLATGGLSMYVKVNGNVILFDTGNTAGPLLERLEESGLDAALIDAVVLSHGQSNHVHGDLSDVLSATSSKAKIYVPAPAAEKVSQGIPGANVVAVSKPIRVLPDAWLVGPLQVDAGEGTTVGQALVLDRPDGLVVIVGCSYPSVPSVVQQIKEVFGHRRINLLAGGFHLRGTSKKDIREISLNLQQKGVKCLALSQCTGDPAMKIFREEWGDRVVSLDFGKPIGY